MYQTLSRLTLWLAIVLIAQTAAAQTTAITDSTSKAKADSVYKSQFNRRGKSIYLESAGTGVAYSLNYDMRFAPKQNGWGARIGASYFKSSGVANTFTVPIMVNYLWGKHSHYLEAGAGATLYYYEGSIYDNVFDKDRFEYDINNNNFHSTEDYYIKRDRYSAFFATAFGYRYQPLKGGFIFRAGVNTIVDSEFWVPLWPYISVGYSFKNKAKAK